MTPAYKRSDSDEEAAPLPLITPGEYKIEAVIGGAAAMPSSQDATSWEAIRTSGGSALAMPKGHRNIQAVFQLHTPEGDCSIPFSLYANRRGQLSAASFTLEAASLEDALAAAWHALESYLSDLAFRFQVPLEVTAWHVKEVSTGVQRIAARMDGPLRELPSVLPKSTGNEVINRLRTTYREGMLATSPSVQALHFFKVIEAVHGLRNERRERTAATAQPYLPPRERIPGTIEELTETQGHLAERFTPWLGKKFTKVWDKELRDPVRNAAAHLNAEGLTLTRDRYENTVRISNVVPVLHYIAVEMLQCEIEDQAKWPTPSEAVDEMLGPDIKST